MSNSLKLLQEIQNDILKAKNMAGTSKTTNQAIGSQRADSKNINRDLPLNSNTKQSDLDLSNSIDINPQQMKSSYKEYQRSKESK